MSKPVKKDFCCRFCGHSSYSSITRELDGLIAGELEKLDILSGDEWELIFGYQCDRCSIKFHDPEKFSLTQVRTQQQDKLLAEKNAVKTP
ncbi:MAG: hypothetical protein PHO56_02810 [Patescibacteria group bacterium]|nr:hypothetical protein [Patescibacteria group bacterium]